MTNDKGIVEKMKFTTILTCGGCNNQFEAKITNCDRANNQINQGRSLLICPNCSRLLPSSRIIQLEGSTGRQHKHEEWKKGDVVI